MSEDNSLQKFQLPEPALCIGGFLLIELLGRVQTQEEDDLYYICVSHVRADGMSLSPKFSVKTLKNSADLVLECNPYALIDVPVDTPVVETSNVEALGPQGQIQHWGYLVNILQQYIPGFQNHHAEEGEDDVEEEIDDDDFFQDEEEDEEFI